MARTDTDLNVFFFFGRYAKKALWLIKDRWQTEHMTNTLQPGINIKQPPTKYLFVFLFYIWSFNWNKRWWLSGVSYVIHIISSW